MARRMGHRADGGCGRGAARALLAGRFIPPDARHPGAPGGTGMLSRRGRRD